MAVRKDVEDELAEIFKRFGSQEPAQPTIKLSLSGNIAGRDICQITLNITGAFDQGNVCAICKEIGDIGRAQRS